MKSIKVILKSYSTVFRAAKGSAVLSFVTYVLAGILPFIIAALTNDLLNAASEYLSGTGNRWMIYELAIKFLAAYLISYSLLTVQSVIENYGIYEKTLHVLKRMIGEKTARLALIDFENTDCYDLSKRAKNCVSSDAMPRLFLYSMRIGANVVSVISVSLLLISYSYGFIPFIILSIIPNLISRIIRGNEFYQLKTCQVKDQRMADYLWNLFSNSIAQKEMRSMGSCEYVTDKWKKLNFMVNRQLWAFYKQDSKSLFLCELFNIAGYVSSIVFCFISVMRGNLEIGVLGACVITVKNVQDSIVDMIYFAGEVPKYIKFANDFFGFMSLKEEEKGTVPFGGFKSIEADGVSFSYPNSNRSAIKDVSFKIRKGETVVIVGENGSGKTTLAKLIQGLYHTSNGTVKYDGVDVDDLDKYELYRHIAIVPQNFGHYKLTLRENVAISDTDKKKKKKRIVECLERVDAEFAKDDLDEQIGREFDGREYSGGQWQRIALARSIFKDADMVILDEPTSALDPVAEAEILKNFLEISHEKTAIIISHRVGLCKYADQIILMKDGSIAESGRFEALMGKKGGFYDLYKAQAKWYQ